MHKPRTAHCEHLYLVLDLDDVLGQQLLEDGHLSRARARNAQAVPILACVFSSGVRSDIPYIHSADRKGRGAERGDGLPQYFAPPGLLPLTALKVLQGGGKEGS